MKLSVPHDLTLVCCDIPIVKIFIHNVARLPLPAKYPFHKYPLCVSAKYPKVTLLFSLMKLSVPHDMTLVCCDVPIVKILIHNVARLPLPAKYPFLKYPFCVSAKYPKVTLLFSLMKLSVPHDMTLVCCDVPIVKFFIFTVARLPLQANYPFHKELLFIRRGVGTPHFKYLPIAYTIQVVTKIIILWYLPLLVPVLLELVLLQ